MFSTKIIKIPLFVLILLLSSTLIFLASCRATATGEFEESAQSAEDKEEAIEKVDDTTEEEMIEEDVEPIDSKLLEDFTDLKDTKEVTINMIDISFDIPKIIIDAGTTVTWINQDK